MYWNLFIDLTICWNITLQYLRRTYLWYSKTTYLEFLSNFQLSLHLLKCYYYLFTCVCNPRWSIGRQPTFSKPHFPELFLLILSNCCSFFWYLSPFLEVTCSLVFCFSFDLDDSKWRLALWHNWTLSSIYVLSTTWFLSPLESSLYSPTVDCCWKCLANEFKVFFIYL